PGDSLRQREDDGGGARPTDKTAGAGLEESLRDEVVQAGERGADRPTGRNGEGGGVTRAGGGRPEDTVGHPLPARSARGAGPGVADPHGLAVSGAGLSHQRSQGPGEE